MNETLKIAFKIALYEQFNNMNTILKLSYQAMYPYLHVMTSLNSEQNKELCKILIIQKFVEDHIICVSDMLKDIDNEECMLKYISQFEST